MCRFTLISKFLKYTKFNVKFQISLAKPVILFDSALGPIKLSKINMQMLEILNQIYITLNNQYLHLSFCSDT